MWSSCRRRRRRRLVSSFNVTHDLVRPFSVEHPVPRYASANFYDKKKSLRIQFACVTAAISSRQRSKNYFHLQKYSRAGIGKDTVIGTYNR